MLKQQYTTLRGINRLYHNHEDTAKVYITQSSNLVGSEYLETLKNALIHKSKALLFRLQAQHLPIARQDSGHLNRIQVLKDEIRCLDNFILSYGNSMNTYYNKTEKHLMSEIFHGNKNVLTLETINKPIKRYSLKPQGFVR